MLIELLKYSFNVLDDKKENRFASEQDEYGSETMSEINIVGRIILNIWRIMRHEVKFSKILLKMVKNLTVAKCNLHYTGFI